MKVFLLLGLMVCVAQAKNGVLIQLLAKVRIGNCDGDCPCEDEVDELKTAQEKLAALESEADSLQDEIDSANNATSSVENAENAVDNMTQAMGGGGRHRRYRRAATTVSYTSCEDSTQSLAGNVGDVALQIIQGILDALANVASNFEVTKLDCYTSLAKKMAEDLRSGALSVPNNTDAIFALANNVSSLATEANSDIASAITGLRNALANKKAEIEAQEDVVRNLGGTVEEKVTPKYETTAANQSCAGKLIKVPKNESEKTFPCPSTTPKSSTPTSSTTSSSSPTESTTRKTSTTNKTSTTTNTVSSPETGTAPVTYTVTGMFMPSGSTPTTTIFTTPNTSGFTMASTSSSQENGTAPETYTVTGKFMSSETSPTTTTIFTTPVPTTSTTVVSTTTTTSTATTSTTLSTTTSTTLSTATSTPTPCPVGCWSPTARNTRVFDGRNASEHEYPYQVGLIRNGSFGCGGVIISETWILTAAHCVYKFSSKKSKTRPEVAFNSVKLSESKKAEVKRIIIHPDAAYCPSPCLLVNDIALIELCEALNFKQPGVKPVCFTTKDKDQADKGTLTGWGDQPDNSTPPVLQEVTLDILSSEKCKEISQKNKYLLPPDETYICTSTPGKDFTQGDSGGPLVGRTKDGCLTLLGIVSYGDCGRNPFLGIYMRVSAFSDWICKTTNTCKPK